MDQKESSIYETDIVRPICEAVGFSKAAKEKSYFYFWVFSWFLQLFALASHSANEISSHGHLTTMYKHCIKEQTAYEDVFKIFIERQTLPECY